MNGFNVHLGKRPTPELPVKRDLEKEIDNLKQANEFLANKVSELQNRIDNINVSVQIVINELDERVEKLTDTVNLLKRK